MCAHRLDQRAPRSRFNLLQDKAESLAIGIQGESDNLGEPVNPEAEPDIDSVATSDALLLARIEKMREYILSAPHLSALRELRERYPEARIYLVGGSVRDAMVDCDYKDLDFCICGVPYEELEAHFKSTVSKVSQVVLVGRNFGVMKFRPDGYRGEYIDIALPRSERSTGLGMREFDVQADHAMTIEEDLSRRDLTINAIALDINTGELVDLAGQGLQDMKDGVIRAMGDPYERFNEDRSRILRTLRFACKYNFDIHTDTAAAVRDMLPEIHLERRVKKKRGEEEVEVNERVVPWELIGKEFGKSIEANPVRTLKLWAEYGAIDLIADEISVLQQTAVPEGQQPFGGTLYDRLVEKMPLLPTDASFQLRLAVLFHELGSCSGAVEDGESPAQASERLADQIIHRLVLTQFSAEKLNVAEIKQVLRNSSLSEVVNMNLAELEQAFFIREGEELTDLLPLLSVHAQAAGEDMVVIQRLEARLNQVRAIHSQPQLVRNDILKNQLDIDWDQARRIAQLIRDRQLTGALTDAGQALNYARELVASEQI